VNKDEYKMAPFDRSHTTPYESANVSIAFSCTITLKNIDLERLRITQSHCKLHHLVDRIRLPIEILQ